MTPKQNMTFGSSVDISVVIVNYNTADFIVRCLASVSAQEGGCFEIFVVDNASADESTALIRSRFPRVNLIESPVNLGFARANNLLLGRCRGTYVYFLNPDTELRPGAFGAILHHMEKYPEAGLAGTRLVYPDGTLQPSTERRYPGERHTGKELGRLAGDIAWVMGASIVARREVFERLKGFDERFFLYGEDLDLCFRARRLGWRIGFIPDAVAVHWEGQSERKSLPSKVRRKKMEAELKFYRKHYSGQSLKAIRKANLTQAFWRIGSISLQLPFTKDKTRLHAKMEMYREAARFWQSVVVG